MYYPNPSDANASEYKALRRLCFSCEMQRQCLEWALHHESYGNWGGYTMNDIERIRKQRRISFSDASVVFYSYQQRRAS